MEAMGKLVKMNVVIIGMRGLGVEVAKNLILAGPASVTVVDDMVVSVNDLGANFYLAEEHVGKTTRAAASVAKLSELNPYVKVQAVSITEVDNLPSVQVICQTELINNPGVFLDPKNVNEMARSRGAGYICSVGLGPWGFAFVDFGEKHIINDVDGENTAQFVVVDIEKGEKTRIRVHEDNAHSFSEGDYVQLREVDGMKQINELAPAKVVEKVNPFVFKIELDSTNWDEYTLNGIVENVKVPKEESYHDWATSFKNPVASTADGMLPIPDLSKFGRGEQLHIALGGLIAYLDENKSFPDLS